ncbi:hypothetical protein SH528x_000362 [Novipirellula sp. SH528]|uniref:hypothetical protein n=1 Tax=Novipirellula sp. SH528 TaxID=3454466 RepID=UPI003FA11334
MRRRHAKSLLISVISGFSVIGPKITATDYPPTQAKFPPSFPAKSLSAVRNTLTLTLPKKGNEAIESSTPMKWDSSIRTIASV